jgi:hypothetical protein
MHIFIYDTSHIIHFIYIRLMHSNLHLLLYMSSNLLGRLAALDS